MLPVRVEALVAAGADADIDALLGQFALWLDDRTAPAPTAALATCRAIVAEAKNRSDGRTPSVGVHVNVPTRVRMKKDSC
ncbi:hypothetical protein [Streptomyces sp. NPDC060366]|uniref:hypothetical protein n=1 Tax=Streptomyces sp. NPDC060366 TaxID=3347105 RepID=UPI0036537BCF